MKLAVFVVILMSAGSALANAIDDALLRFNQAKNEEEKDSSRAEIKKHFYAQATDEDKDRIREFFKKNRKAEAPTGEAAPSSRASREPASMR